MHVSSFFGYIIIYHNILIFILQHGFKYISIIHGLPDALTCSLIRMQTETITAERTKSNSTLPPTDPRTTAVVVFESSTFPLVVVAPINIINYMYYAYYNGYLIDSQVSNI